MSPPLSSSGRHRLDEMRRGLDEGGGGLERDAPAAAPAADAGESVHATSGHGLSRSRQTRRRLERALVDSSQLDAERARAVTSRLERAREQLLRATSAGLEDELRAELTAAIQSAESFAGEVATLAARRDRLTEEAQAAIGELSNLERRALMAAAKTEALERAQALDDEEAAAAPLSEEEIARRIELENELRDRLEDIANLSSKLTEIERAAGESRDQKLAAEGKLSDERRKRIELQLEHEKLEERHEKFQRERLAVDESARTLKERFDARTKRLYRALVLNEGALGEQIASSTHELMEANEELIRLQKDKESLLQQVERMRVALRRAKGLPDSARVEEEDRVVASQERVSEALSQLKGQLDRRLDDLIETFEAKLATIRAAPEPNPSTSAVLQGMRLAEFFKGDDDDDEGEKLASSSASAVVPAPAEPPRIAEGLDPAATAEDASRTSDPPLAPPDEPPGAGISSVYLEAVKAIEELPPLPGLADSPAPVPPDTLPALPIDATKRLMTPHAESTRHRLQQALEAGLSDEGELESLFQKQRRRLRSQDESSTPHGIVVDGTAPAPEVSPTNQPTPADRTPHAEEIEVTAARGLSDAILRAKDALRVRLERQGLSPDREGAGEGTIQNPPALLHDDEDDDEDDGEAERVVEFIRSIDEKHERPRPSGARPVSLDLSGTLATGNIADVAPAGSDANETVRGGHDGETVRGDVRPTVVGGREVPRDDTTGLVFLDRAPGSTTHGPSAPPAALADPSPRRTRIAPAGPTGLSKVLSPPTTDGHKKGLGPPTFVKLAGRAPGAEEAKAPEPEPSGATTSAVFRSPVLSAPTRSFADAHALVHKSKGSPGVPPTRVVGKAAAVAPHARVVLSPRVLGLAACVALAVLALATTAGWRLIRHRTSARPVTAAHVSFERADVLPLEPAVFEAWRATLHGYARALGRGVAEPVGSSLSAFASDYQESDKESLLRDALDGAAKESGLRPPVFWGVLRRIALADQRITAARQLAVERHWKEREVRESALDACGPNATSHRDVDFYLAVEGDVQASWAELVSASRVARAARAAARPEDAR